MLGSRASKSGKGGRRHADSSGESVVARFRYSEAEWDDILATLRNLKVSPQLRVSLERLGSGYLAPDHTRLHEPSRKQILRDYEAVVKDAGLLLSKLEQLRFDRGEDTQNILYQLSMPGFALSEELIAGLKALRKAAMEDARRLAGYPTPARRSNASDPDRDFYTVHLILAWNSAGGDLKTSYDEVKGADGRIVRFLTAVLRPVFLKKGSRMPRPDALRQLVRRFKAATKL